MSAVQNDEFLRLTMNAVRQDLLSRNEAFETLALSFIGNGARAHTHAHTHSTSQRSHPRRSQRLADSSAQP